MKILLLNDYATPTGGAELMMLALRDGLRQRGHDARLFASCAQGGKAASLADYECFGTTSRWRTLLQTMNFSAFQQLRQVLAEFQPDLVHVRIFLTQLSPLILPLLRSIPSLYHVAWYRSICPLGTKLLPNGQLCSHSVGTACYRQNCLSMHDWMPLMLQMHLWRRWKSAFNQVVANSEAVKQQLVLEGMESIEVVWNGIPVHPSRSPLGSPPVVAFAGRLVWEKGIDVLLQAFSQVINHIPEARLLLAGDGPECDRLKSLISQLGLQRQVSMLGYLPRSEMATHFANAWVQVVPSRWAEPFGIVATEAMMRGTAVIASNCGGLTEIVRDGQTGFLVPQDDVASLAQSLRLILSDRQLAERMGQAGRKVALANFSEATFVDRFEQIYQTLIQDQKRLATPIS
ncbi:MAG: glycosyltransferase family 4 protein [Goleter apudmare HA4340-LM2]|jgi:glycosyltransferase involved in cell wall biosynthesis|nr:glycosyltransferase family 4 protein [Goleter apudmare HA4340-LM2]